MNKKEIAQQFARAAAPQPKESEPLTTSNDQRNLERLQKMTTLYLKELHHNLHRLNRLTSEAIEKAETSRKESQIIQTHSIWQRYWMAIVSGTLCGILSCLLTHLLLWMRE